MLTSIKIGLWLSKRFESFSHIEGLYDIKTPKTLIALIANPDRSKWLEEKLS